MKVTAENQKNAEELMNALIAKCWEDESFKQQLVAAPAETIEQFSGQTLEIPEGVTLVVNDQTSANYMHINIPAKPSYEDFELTDEQLEAVAGGLVWIPVTLALCCLAYNGYKDAKNGN